MQIIIKRKNLGGWLVAGEGMAETSANALWDAVVPPRRRFAMTGARTSFAARLAAACLAAVLLPAGARAEPSVRDLAAWCMGNDPVLKLNCRSFIEGFVAGVAVRTYNDRALYCLGRPLDDYIRSFLAVTAESEALRAEPRASAALFQAMTRYMNFKGPCPRQ